MYDVCIYKAFAGILPLHLLYLYTTATSFCLSDRAAAAAKQPASGDEEEGDEEWTLSKIYTIKEILKSKPTTCERSNDGKVNCGLVACSRWEAKGQKPWNSCLDCQVK